MNDRKNSRETVLPVWPFLAGDICMALIAVCIFAFSARPMGGVAMFFCAAAMGFGAWLLTTPFLKNQSSELRGRDLDSLNPIADQLRRLEELKRLLSDSLAKGPASKDNESALLEISAALKAMSDEQNQKFQDIQAAFTQEIAGLESRALLAIQSIPRSSAPSDPNFMSPPVAGADPEQVASMVTSRLRPELAAESEKTLSQMKEHVDESFSQAMSEMADLKLALEQALETIANAAPGTVLAAVAPVAAQPNQAQITEAVSNANANIETRLRSQVKSVQRLTTEVGSLRRMMRRAMSVKGGASWNMELETSSEPDYSLDMDNEQTDWTSLAPRSEEPSTEAQAQAQDSLSTPEENPSAITTPDNDDLLEFPSDGFSSPGNFETLEGDVFLTQFSDTTEKETASESLSEVRPGLEEDQPQDQHQDQETAEAETEVEKTDASQTDSDSALSSDPELRDWPVTDESNAETETTDAQVETFDNALESTETAQPEVAGNSVESLDPASDSEAPASPEPQKESQEAPALNEEQSEEATKPQTEQAATADLEEDSSNNEKTQPVRDPKLPSVKAAVRNLFDEAEQDED